jgi:hypothetical protein
VRDDIDASIRDADRMDIIQDQLASFWLLSPIGAVIFVGFTALFLTGLPARILEVIEGVGWRLRVARQRRAARSDAAAASESAGSGKMGR